MKVKYKIHAEMEDESRSFDVVADQRDLAAWEAHPDGRGTLESAAYVTTLMRFLAWNAGRRQRKHALTWEQFNLEQCVEARDMDEAAEDVTPEDPGMPAPSAGISS